VEHGLMWNICLVTSAYLRSRTIFYFYFFAQQLLFLFQGNVSSDRRLTLSVKRWNVIEIDFAIAVMPSPERNYGAKTLWRHCGGRHRLKRFVVRVHKKYFFKRQKSLHLTCVFGVMLILRDAKYATFWHHHLSTLFPLPLFMEHNATWISHPP